MTSTTTTTTTTTTTSTEEATTMTSKTTTTTPTGGASAMTSTTTSSINAGDAPQKFVKYGRAIHFIGDIKPELRHRTVFTAHIDATGKISISLQNKHYQSTFADPGSTRPQLNMFVELG